MRGGVGVWGGGVIGRGCGGIYEWVWGVEGGG